MVENLDNLFELYRHDTLCIFGIRISVLRSHGDCICENGMSLNDSENTSQVKYNVDILL